MSFLVVVRYLHLLFAFGFTGALLAAHVNTLAARRAGGWAVRASHFEANRRLSLFVALPALIGTGVLGQVLAMALGYRMADTRAFQIANGVWVALLIVTLALELPAAMQLAAAARSAAAGPPDAAAPASWGPALARWRAGNAAQLVLFLAMLAVMAAPWRP